jgi:hypothetical protein
MKLSRTIQIIVLLANTLVCTGLGSYGAEIQSRNNQSSVLKGQATVYAVLTDEIQTRMGFTCSADKDGNIVVSAVRSGMAAAKSQIQTGDHILSAEMNGKFLALTIRRNSKILNARLKDEANPTLLFQAPRADRVVRKPFALNAEKTEVNDNKLASASGALAQFPGGNQNLGADQFALRADQGFRLLADYDIELIVDRSMSMRERDCPGGLSRWQWLGVQSANLANSLSPYVPNGLTVIPFATEFDVFEHAKAQDIARIFNGVGQQFGTRLFEPLAERLDNYFSHNGQPKKPLLIVVLTDGVPVPRFEPALVVRELVEASRHMTSPWQATVIFGQIGGNDRAGEEFLTDLERNLTTYGARYPMVHTISFDTLQARGLGPSLVAAIQKYAPRYAQIQQGAPAVVGNRIQRYIPTPQVQQFLGNRLKQMSPVDSDIDVSAFNDPLAPPDGDPFQRGDRFVSNPQLDPNGGRHYANGKHFDLSSMPVASAIDTVRASTLNEMPPGLRRRFNRGFPNPGFFPMAGGFPGGRRGRSNAPTPFDPVRDDDP